MLDVRRILRNLFSLGLMRAASAGLSFCLLWYLARAWASPERVGEFATLLTAFLLMQHVTLLGLNVLLIRDVAAAPDVPADRVMATLAIGVAVSIVLVPLFGLAGLAKYPPSMAPSFWFVGLSMIPTAFALTAESVLIGKERMGVLAAVNCVEIAARVAGCIALAAVGASLTWLFAWFLVGRVAAAVAYALRPELRAVLAPRHFTPNMLRTYLRQCPVFFLIVALSAGLQRLDTLLLGTLGGMDAAGLYYIPYRVYEMALMVPTQLSVVVFPTFARLYATASNDLARLYRNLLRVLLLIGLPIALSVALASREILAVFGPRFAEGHAALQILVFAVVVGSIDLVLTNMSIGGNRERLALIVLAIALPVYVALLVLLIPRWGIQGAAAATLAVAFLKTGSLYFLVRRQIAWSGALLTELVRPGLASVALGAAFWLLRGQSLLVSLPTGAGVYAAALAFTGTFTAGDLALLRRMSK
ncbi:MAG: polysaccharide biosynthesis protein [Planctomycetes bacterium]|nr:polysaccharide biosynthesis protein [Planctomycetota bacterium]